MKITIKVLSAPEAALYCRLQLGSGYDWTTRLADWRRGRSTGYGGPIVLPTTRISKARLKRPVYLPEDLFAFVAAYRAYDAASAKGVMPQITLIEVDTDTSMQSWKVRPSAPAKHAIASPSTP